MVLLNLMDEIYNELDNKNHSIGIFIDRSSIWYHTLLSYIEIIHYYVKELNILLFVNLPLIGSLIILSNRKQFVNLNAIDSSLLTILSGVSQRSILGRLLFLIYINDIVKTSKRTKFIIFADDTNLFFKLKNRSTPVIYD